MIKKSKRFHFIAGRVMIEVQVFCTLLDSVPFCRFCRGKLRNSREKNPHKLLWIRFIRPGGMPQLASDTLCTVLRIPKNYTQKLNSKRDSVP